MSRSRWATPRGEGAGLSTPVEAGSSATPGLVGTWAGLTPAGPLLVPKSKKRRVRSNHRTVHWRRRMKNMELSLFSQSGRAAAVPEAVRPTWKPCCSGVQGVASGGRCGAFPAKAARARPATSAQRCSELLPAGSGAWAPTPPPPGTSGMPDRYWHTWGGTTFKSRHEQAQKTVNEARVFRITLWKRT